MALNRKVIMKRGGVKTFRFTVTDALQDRVDLTNFTITAYATEQGGADHIIDATVTILNQTTNTGQFSVKFDESAGENPAGTYDLEIKALNPLSEPDYWPCVEGVPFGKYIIEESKA